MCVSAEIYSSVVAQPDLHPTDIQQQICGTAADRLRGLLLYVSSYLHMFVLRRWLLARAAYYYTYVCSYYYACSHTTIYTCPHTTVCVCLAQSVACTRRILICICVLKLLHIRRLILLYVSSYYYIYVSSYYCVYVSCEECIGSFYTDSICVLIRLYMCPHTVSPTRSGM